MIGLEGTAVGVTNEKSLHLLPSISRSLTNLPNETLSMILKQLRKDQLKSVRCACKFLETLVSPLLFDKVIISPHRKNLDVFRRIAEHSDLCQYPRELVYDISKFGDHRYPSFAGVYYRDLCKQMRSDFRSQSHSSIHYADKEIERLLRMICGLPRQDADYSHFQVVRRGFELYLEKAKEESYYNYSGEFLACLSVGLMRLPNVDKMRFQSSWNSRHLHSVHWSRSPQDLRIFSSPLARTWSPFHLRPKIRKFDDYTDQELNHVMMAFSIAKKPLRSLDIPSMLYKYFYSGSPRSQTFRQHSRIAMYHLKSLKLEVHDEYPKSKTLSVDLLADALLHLPGLRRLSLCGNMEDKSGGLMSFKELFQAGRLPALGSLCLGKMLGSAAEILSFLRSTPRLRELSLTGIELSEGTWADLVDDMRQWLSLDSLTLGAPLRQEGGVDISEDVSWAGEDMSDYIQYYVRHGGNNPLRMMG